MPKTIANLITSLLIPLLTLLASGGVASAQTDPNIIDTGHQVDSLIKPVEPYVAVISDTLIMVDGETVLSLIHI